MENEIPQIDLFNCNNRYFNENNSWSLNYQSLPVIMSALKMDNMPSSSTAALPSSTLSSQSSSTSSSSSSSMNTTAFQSETVFQSASKQRTYSEHRKNSLSSCSDDENETENHPQLDNERQSPFKYKFRELRSGLRTSDALMKINRRTITKPKKLIHELNLTPKTLKKLYIDSGKKLGRFKPSNLETIFEEPLVNDQSDQFKLVGKKKLKRSLSCSDGLNITKATIKNRRQKIKRIFGKRFALKKINLAEFKEKLNSSMEEWEDINVNDV